jgi:hypothetical protein
MLYVDDCLSNNAVALCEEIFNEKGITYIDLLENHIGCFDLLCNILNGL